MRPDSFEKIKIFKRPAQKTKKIKFSREVAFD